MTRSVQLTQVPGRYAIARLGATDPIPDWLDGPGLQAVIRADDELTLLCLQDRIPAGIECDGPWSCFRSIGPFAFQTTGIVQSLVNPLSDAGIGVCVLCTFDGEHLLVPEADAGRAAQTLIGAGHRLQPHRGKADRPDPEP